MATRPDLTCERCDGPATAVFRDLYAFPDNGYECCLPDGNGIHRFCESHKREPRITHLDSRAAAEAARDREARAAAQRVNS